MSSRLGRLKTRLSQKAKIPMTYRLLRKTPVNEEWGFDRGLPIDRYYIENFLQANKNMIQGNVLSIGDDHYAKRYSHSLSSSDVLHINEVPEATIVADLTNAPNIKNNTFDCFMLIQTLQLIFDINSAIETTHRILKPGGITMVTVPGITPLKDAEWNDSWCWSFTTHSIHKLLAQHFPKDNIHVQSHGNIAAACGFLHGLAPQDMTRKALDASDCRYPVIISAVARK